MILPCSLLAQICPVSNCPVPAPTSLSPSPHFQFQLRFQIHFTNVFTLNLTFRSQLMDMVPQNSSGAALASINTAAWCQFFQCALYLEVRGGQAGCQPQLASWIASKHLGRSCRLPHQTFKPQSALNSCLTDLTARQP